MTPPNARRASVQPVSGELMDFTSTAAYAEQAIYRKIAMTCGDFTKSQRAVLVKMINLWFYHRGRDGFIQPAHDSLMRSLGIAERTLRMAIARLKSAGFIRLIGGGVGRGNHAAYVVDLTMLQETLAPEIEVVCQRERVSLQGEIKGANGRSPYKDSKTCSQAGGFIRLSPSLSFDTLGTLFRRIRANASAWFRPKPITLTGWTGGALA